MTKRTRISKRASRNLTRQFRRNPHYALASIGARLAQNLQAENGPAYSIFIRRELWEKVAKVWGYDQAQKD